MSEPADRGARRRAFTRRVLGKPGSVVRWSLGTLVWFVACLTLALYVGWIGKIVVFMFAWIVPIALYNMRSQLIGDEDELRAELRRRRKGLPHQHVPDGDALLEDQEDWFSGQPEGGVAPPPPIMDEVSPSSSVGSASEGDAGDAR